MLRLFSGGRIKCTAVERISPNVVIDISSDSKLNLGYKVRIHSGSRITAAKGGVVEIGANVRINNNCRIACRNHIVIGEGAEFGPGVIIYDHDHVFSTESGVAGKEYKTAPVKIGKNSWIGAGTIILCGSEIGDNCVVGAGCVIKGKYPSGKVIIQKRETIVR